MLNRLLVIIIAVTLFLTGIVVSAPKEQQFLQNNPSDLQPIENMQQSDCTSDTCTVDAIAVFENNDDIYYSFYGHNANDVFHWWSLDAGSATEIVAPSPAWDFYPDIGYQASTGIAVWGDFKQADTVICDPPGPNNDYPDPQFSGDIRFAYFNGTAWENNGIVAASPGPDHVYHHPSVAVDTNGNAVVIWIHSFLPRDAYNCRYFKFTTMEVRSKIWNGTEWVNENVVRPSTDSECGIGDPHLPNFPDFDCQHFTDITFTEKQSELDQPLTVHEAIGVWYDPLDYTMVCNPQVPFREYWPKYALWDGSAFSAAADIPGKPGGYLTTLLNVYEYDEKMGIAADLLNNSKTVFPVFLQDPGDFCSGIFAPPESVWEAKWIDEAWTPAAQYSTLEEPDIAFSSNNAAVSVYTGSNDELQWAYEPSIMADFTEQGSLLSATGNMPAVADIHHHNKTIALWNAGGMIQAAEHNYTPSAQWENMQDVGQGKNPEVAAKAKKGKINVILVIIDGMGHQDFNAYVNTHPASNITKTLSKKEIQFTNGAISVYPSYTFPNQVSIATGLWPGTKNGVNGHGIMGNCWFDRSGGIGKSMLRKYHVREYDTCTTNAMFQDALSVYTPPGLVNEDKLSAALYDYAKNNSLNSTVIFHMVSTGAKWIPPTKPGLNPLAEDSDMIVYVKGDGKDYDRRALRRLKEYFQNDKINNENFPDILTFYLAGNDHFAHLRGAEHAPAYIDDTIDPIIGQVIEELKKIGVYDGTIWLYAADHGEAEMHDKNDNSHDDFINMVGNDMKSFLSDIDCPDGKKCYPDVYDNDFVRNEVLNEDADIFMLNNGGGGGYIYIRSREEWCHGWMMLSTDNACVRRMWQKFPRLNEDLLPFVRGIADNAKTPGSLLYGKLDDILVRTKKPDDAKAKYYVYRHNGGANPDVAELRDLSVLNPAYLDAVNRLNNFNAPRAPDIILLPNFRQADGWPPAGHYLNVPGGDAHTYYFDRHTEDATHGSLYPVDSEPVLVIGSGGDEGAAKLTELIKEKGAAIKIERPAKNPAPYNTDIAPTIADILDFLGKLKKDSFHGKSIFKQGFKAIVKSPVELHLYDSAARHVGPNNMGGIDEDILTSSYSGSPGGSQEIIVLWVNDSYRVVVKGIGSGTFNLTVEDFNNRLSLEFAGVMTNTTSNATLDLISNNTFLGVDQNGDGIIDINLTANNSLFIIEDKINRTAFANLNSLKNRQVYIDLSDSTYTELLLNISQDVLNGTINVIEQPLDFSQSGLFFSGRQVSINYSDNLENSLDNFVINLSYTDGELLEFLLPETNISIYWFNTTTLQWESFNSFIDFESNVISAFTVEEGNYTIAATDQLPQIHSVNITPRSATIPGFAYSIKVNTSDNIAITHVNAGVNGSEYELVFNPLTSLYEISLTAPGENGFFDVLIKSIDNNNNIAFYNDFIAVDNIGPNISILVPGNITSFNNNTVEIFFVINEDISWIDYNLDNTGIIPLNSSDIESSDFGILSFFLYNLTVGNHSLIMYANDSLNNAGISNEFNFTIDMPIDVELNNPYVSTLSNFTPNGTIYVEFDAFNNENVTLYNVSLKLDTNSSDPDIEFDIPIFRPYQEINFILHWNYSQAGTYQPFAFIDYTEQLPEYDENNNIVYFGDVTILVPPGYNNPPMLDAIGNKTINENETLTIDVNATDPDNDTLTYYTNANEILPSSFTFNNSNGLFTWTPTFDDAGEYIVTFNVTDNELWDSEAITITVNNVNRAPIMQNIGNKTVEENSTLVIDVNATDPDNDILTYFTNARGKLPSNFTFNQSTGLFTWRPRLNESGAYNVTFNVTDGALWDNETITITVTDFVPFNAITSCANDPNAPGLWKLTQNIATSGATCLDINANDVILDCQGYTISSSTRTFFGININQRRNIMVKNCVISQFNAGVAVQGTSSCTNITVENSTTQNQGNYGIDALCTTSSGFNIRKNNFVNGGLDVANAGGGIEIVGSNHVILNNSFSNNNVYGIVASGVSNMLIVNNTFVGATPHPVYKWEGIKLWSGSGVTITGNRIRTHDIGVNLTSTAGNLVYNNYFNNTLNAHARAINAWNITKRNATNIIGGSFIGGNYWHDYIGTDNNGDGIGDTNLPYNSFGSIMIGGDYLPLVMTQIMPGQDENIKEEIKESAGIVEKETPEISGSVGVSLKGIKEINVFKILEFIIRRSS